MCTSDERTYIFLPYRQHWLALLSPTLRLIGIGSFVWVFSAYLPTSVRIRSISSGVIMLAWIFVWVRHVTYSVTPTLGHIQIRYWCRSGWRIRLLPLRHCEFGYDQEWHERWLNIGTVRVYHNGQHFICRSLRDFRGLRITLPTYQLQPNTVRSRIGA